MPNFQAILDAWPSPAATLDCDLTITACNVAYEDVTFRDKVSMLGRSIFEIFPGSDRPQCEVLQNSFLRVLKNKKPDHISNFCYDLNTPVNSRFGDLRWTVTNIPLISPAGEIAGILHCPLNITALTKTHGEPDNGPLDHAHSVVRDTSSTQDVEGNSLHHLFQQAPGFVCILHGPQHVYEFANDAYYQLVGHRKIIGKVLAEVLPEVVSQGFLEKLDRVYRTGEPFIGRALPIDLQRISGGSLEQRYIDLIYQPIFDEDRQVTGIFVQGHDVSEAYFLAKEIAYQASHDCLTGIANRREFSRLTEDIGGPGPHALLYMDIDHFKIVNDRCGHAAGDILLQEVTSVLESQTIKSDILARLGGDEFALVRQNCNAEKAVELAHHLRKAIKSINFIWQGRRYSITLSVGVANFGEVAGVDYETALGLADAACFLAKEKGRDRVKLNRPTDEEIWKQLSDMDNVTRLQEAIKDDRIVLYGQRIFHLGASDSEQAYYEILSRLRNEAGELIGPGAFIPAAERFGMIEDLDRHVVTKSFAHLDSLDENLRSSVCYFINISGITLSSPTFFSFIERLLSDYPAVLTPQICFEVTETAAISDIRRSAVAMQKLAEYGFRFALDDFGSGMASFAYLQELPVQFVKIDGEFVKTVAANPASAIIVESVAKIGACMEIRTIAESIESATMLRKLQPLGVHYGQGYALHEPEDLDTAIRSNHELSFAHVG
ncbi:diguanylate cyclase (GGDEF) domain-containing protein [Filomicrobium insigne]|uniref:Diguanylate cyclase (GGDEF) domain-containing protein n=1 Tax=Filomicrobium insigne TaxID=418854 RepID=A0A1H0JPF4_9HYPH|nr:EAL domain-containing protein [Filomicrobium insigne]SDO45443.1 diguanylate cyclase (GGDEF) domain-containing protein [Filomicrobium insigne]